MNKLHNAITMVLGLGVALLCADRIAHYGPDRELARQLDEIRRMQHAAHGDGERSRGHHEQYAIPATRALVEQVSLRTQVMEAPEETEDSPAQAERPREWRISPEEMQTR